MTRKSSPSLFSLLPALVLVAARLRHIAGTRWGMKQYLKMDRIEKQALELAVA
jgi:hypothetical protein